MSSADDYLVIGRVVASYGLKGWVKVKSFTQPQLNLISYKECFIAPDRQGDKNWQPAKIEKGKEHGKGIVVKFTGCDDRNAADLLQKYDVAVQVGQLPELSTEEYYWHQLSDLQVYLYANESGANEGDEQLLGRVSHLLETGSNDVLVIKPCQGSIDEQERLLPYRPEVVLSIDLQTSKMVVDWDPEF